MKDWTGNSKSVYAPLGASNHSRLNRQTEDYYATDPIAIDVLLQEGGVKLKNPVWECACGEGHLSERLKQYAYDVYSSDLVDRGYGEGGVDFLTDNRQWYGDIITNPPYKYAKEFVEHALKVVDDGCKVIMFLKLQFLEGKARKELFTKYPLKRLLVSSSRISCAPNGDFTQVKSSAVAYAWYIWEKGYNGLPTIKWIN